MTETSSTTQACERSWIEAQTLLLAEWARLTDKERTRLVKRHRTLAGLLDALETEWEDFRDAVTLDARRIVEQEQDALARLHEDYVCCVQVATEDGDWAWWSLPEVTGHFAQDGVTHLVADVDDHRLLIRAFRTPDVAEIRNVPREHPFLEQTTEFTLASQGQPFWTEEDQQIAVAEGAIGPGMPDLPPLVWGPDGATTSEQLQERLQDQGIGPRPTE